MAKGFKTAAPEKIDAAQEAPAEPTVDINAVGAAIQANNGPSPEVAALMAQIEALKAQNLALLEAKTEKEADIPGVANRSRAANKVRFRITIDESADPNEIFEVPVGINGRVYQIKRGFQVDVPPEVVSGLTNAVTDRMMFQRDPATGRLTPQGTRKARRFSFTNHGMSVDADGKRLMEELDYNAMR